MIFTSYRFRIPLSLISVACVTVAALSMAITYQTYRNVLIEQQNTASRLAHAMTPVLAQALKHDDIWLAYSLLRGPKEARIALDDSGTQPLFVLLDSAGYVFAASQPRQFPVGIALVDINHSFGALPNSISTAKGFERRLLMSPVRSDDAVLGNLLIIFSESAFKDRLTEILYGGLISITVILGILIPVGWLWGRRMIDPLTSLTHCMERIDLDNISDFKCPTFSGDDEIAHLGQRFQAMLRDLQKKEAMVQQATTQESLAAIGRVAAGVAHEINNPLGGLLAAVDTYRQKPPNMRNPQKTLDLVERGLLQIHETVSALLVESRMESRALAVQDLNDVATLVSGEAHSTGVKVEWNNLIKSDLPLPATPVRQVLINLVMNAIQAAPDRGHVQIDLCIVLQQFHIVVTNAGKQIEPDALRLVFEPFHEHRQGGTGLGLWVTYQIVTQLGGTIEVDSDAERTRARVTIPIHTLPVEVV